MVDADYLFLVDPILNVADALLFFSTALLLAFAPRPTLQRRLLALLLALFGFRMLGALWRFINSDAGLIANPFFYFSRNVEFLMTGALLALLAAYPRPAPLRSWHTAALALGGLVLAVGAGAWLFDRSLLYSEWPRAAGGTTFLFWLTINPGRELTIGLMVASALARARELPAPQRRLAWVLAAVLFLTSLGFAGANLSSGVVEAVGLVPGAESFWLQRWGAIPGDCCDVILYAVLGQIALALGIAAWGARRGHWLPAGLVGLGFAVNFLVFLEPAPTAAVGVVVPLGVLYVAARGGLGPLEAPARAWYGIALAALVTGFFLTAGLLVFFATDPLGSPLVILLALLVGLACASVVLPPGMGWAPWAAGPDERRVATYRTTLQAELDAGLTGPALAAKLRTLRTELGISDREHAVLAHALGAKGAGPAALEPGTLFLDRYRVVRALGRGASGEVYLARDERLGREVALKRLVEHQRRDAAALARFQEEMRLASALQHPNIVAIHDVETIGDDAYLVMEYVPGGSLAERLLQGALAEPEATRLARDLLAALGALHERGIVHRDVKPSNVLLDRAGRAKLGDFTVARASVSGETVGFTHSAGPVGTPAWMAPEQARGVAATARSDLYSAAATLYATLAGRPPVEVGDLGEFEARLRVVTAAPALPLPGVSGRTNAVLARALAKDAVERYASAEEMARALG